MKQHKHFINLFDSNEILSLTRKWGISVPQLNEAIVESGSTDEEEIKSYLRSKGVLQFPMDRLLNYVRTHLFAR